jgi:hypothetical protein
VSINVIVSKLSSFGIFPASYQFGVGGFVGSPRCGPFEEDSRGDRDSAAAHTEVKSAGDLK